MSGTCIKDTGTRPKWGRLKGKKWGWLGWGVVVEGKWRQLYLNSNKKNLIKKVKYDFLLQETG